MENRVMDQLINTLQNIQSTIRTISNNPSSSSNNSISNNNSNSGNNSKNSNSGSSSDMRSSNMRTDTRTPVLVEQSRLFSRNQRNHPYRRRNSNNQRGSGRTLTRTFVCLNRTDQIEVPTAEERMLLYHNKLGESRVVFPVNANSTSVRDILYKSNVHDPVTILRGFQEIFMRGRKLDVTSASEVLEGDTLSIFVSRDRVLETAFEELLDTSCNFRLPLDVTFYGEDAADLGGPRREFLELALREIIKEETGLFKEDDDGSYIFRNSQENIRKRYFFAAGLVCGLSIMQHGPLPCFISESHFDNMLSDAADESQKQFREGLNVVGLVDLMKVKPGIRYLFRQTARTDLTLRKIKHLLLPKFDEPGSNRRRRQELVYDKFLAYLKEVAAGRREVPVGRITLGQVLQFVTGSAWNYSTFYTHFCITLF